MLEKIRNIYAQYYIKRLVKHGLKIGNVSIYKGVNIDANFPWLIEIGNNVVLSPWVYILSHDAAPMRLNGLTKIGKVSIGDNVYIGARTIVLPGAEIGSNSIIGANSVVSGKIPVGVVAVGSPAKPIMTVDEYRNKHQSLMSENPIFDRAYTKWGGGYRTQLCMRCA